MEEDHHFEGDPRDEEVPGDPHEVEVEIEDGVEDPLVEGAEPPPPGNQIPRKTQVDCL